MDGHKSPRTTFIWRALVLRAVDFAILIHFAAFRTASLTFFYVSSWRWCKTSFRSTTTKSQHMVKGGLLLNGVARQSTSIFQLANKDQSLLIRRNSFLILDLGLYIFYCIQGCNLESDGLPCQGFSQKSTSWWWFHCRWWIRKTEMLKVLLFVLRW